MRSPPAPDARLVFLTDANQENSPPVHVGPAEQPRRNGIHVFPVRDGSHRVGVLGTELLNVDREARNGDPPVGEIERLLMKQFRIRRLPVISKEGQLRGILSIDDIVVRALAADAPTSSEIVESLREILKGLQGQPLSVA